MNYSSAVFYSMIYSTIGTLALVSLISHGEQITHYLAENPKYCGTAGKVHNEDCFFVKGNSEALLGGYHLRSADLPNKLHKNLRLACGMGPPDATGRPTVRVEGRGRAAFKRTLPIVGLEITAELSLPYVKMDGGYETASGRTLDFSANAYIRVKQFGKEAISFSAPSRGVCSVHYEGSNVSVYSSIKTDEIYTTNSHSDVSSTRIWLSLESSSNDRIKWNMSGKLGVKYFDDSRSFNGSFPLYNTTVLQ